jgi:S-adenosylmethionine-diacylglycerol 3-amino-3-carboxypropyl transferase
MSSKALLSDAVGLSSQISQQEGRSLMDRLFVRWFDRLVYPLIWEDPVADLMAMGDISGQNMVCLTSGGCNILSYLSAQPAHIAAVDLNEAHLALLALKRTAAEHLSYDEFHQLFALGNVPQNAALMSGLIPHMPEFAQTYWGQVDLTGRAKWFSQDFYHQGLLGNFIGFGHWLAKRLGYDLSAVMQAKTSEEAQAIFDAQIAPVFDSRLVRWLSSQVWVLYGLGIPPRQYEVLKGDEAHMADVLKKRLRHLACDYPLADNYFAWQAFARRFNADEQSALPLYLQQAHYDSTKSAAEKVTIHHQSVTDYLAVRPAMSVDVYVLLDAQDWMSESQLTELWIEINRTARMGARVVFRAAGKESPLEGMLPVALLSCWSTDDDANEAFWQADRSAIYGGCFVYTRIC